MTHQVRAVLEQALKAPDGEWYGLQIAAATGLPGGTLYPILARIEQAGWVAARWEDPAAHRANGRLPRRDYRFTPDGAEQAAAWLARPRGRRANAAEPWPPGNR
jgi:PadR family transcriptional regulator, regulatory protein PadR